MPFSKKSEISGHAAAIYACAVEGNLLYSGSGDKFLARWLIDQGIQDAFSIRFEFSVYALALHKNHLVVGLADGGLYVFDLQERKEKHYFIQHTVGIFSIEYNLHLNHWYVGDADGNLSVWNSDFQLLIYLPLDAGKIRSIAIAKNGGHVALACQDGTIRVFETTHFNEIHTINAHQGGTTSVYFHPFNEDLLFSGGKDALFKCWNWTTETEMKRVVAHTFAIYDILSVENGTKLVTASRDKHVKIWNTEDMGILKRLDVKEGGHRHSVNGLCKINEEEFVSYSDDRRMIIWEKDRTN